MAGLSEIILLFQRLGFLNPFKGGGFFMPSRQACIHCFGRKDSNSQPLNEFTHQKMGHLQEVRYMWQARWDSVMQKLRKHFPRSPGQQHCDARRGRSELRTGRWSYLSLVPSIEKYLQKNLDILFWPDFASPSSTVFPHLARHTFAVQRKTIRLLFFLFSLCFFPIYLNTSSTDAQKAS